jgi:hypothetical protein
MSTSDLMKSMDRLSSVTELSKSLFGRNKNVLEWTYEFAGTPLHIKALEALKQRVQYERELEQLESKEMNWRELEEMPRSRREEIRKRQNKARSDIRRKLEAADAKMKQLESDLIDHRIKQAKAEKVSQTVIKSSTTETPEKASGEKSMNPDGEDENDPDLKKRCSMKKSMVIGSLVHEVDGDEDLSKSIEDGVTCLEVNPWNVPDLQKSVTLQQDIGPTGPGMDTDPVLRQQVIEETVHSDPAGNAGQGGLASWFSPATKPAVIEDETDPFLAIQSKKLDRL